jgi:hypothetical protein
MNKHQSVTWTILLVTATILIAFDFAIIRIWPDSTISQVLLTVAHQYPVVPFAFGFLMGHLFAPQTGADTWQNQKR